MTNNVTDIDALLGSDDATPGQSQDQQQPTGDQPAKSSEMEVEFNKLTGSAQDRFQKLLRRAKTAETEAEKARALAYSGAQLPPAPPTMNPDIQQAVKQLDNVGVATKEYVDRVIAQREGQRQYQENIKRLSEMENGQDGRPKFDQYEYEDFVRQNPHYQYYSPQDVFGIMYQKELIDWEIQHRQSGNSQSAPLKNTKTFSGTEVWTPEYIEEQIKSQGSGWYEKNFEKIQKVLESQ